MKTKTNPLSIKQIKEIASTIRKQYNIEKDECFPIYDILERLQDEGALSVQIVSNDDPMLDDNVPAIYNSFDNFIYLKENVLLDLENNNYRSNFTLAHEFFHYIQTQIYEFQTEMVEDCRPFEEIDWQANEFAGELLLPIDELDKDEEYLSNHFKVSIECVLTRKVQRLKRLKREREKENEFKQEN